MTKTVILSVTCAVALVIPGLAGAQDHNPFSNSYTSPFADFDPTPSPAPWPEMPPVYQAPAQMFDPNPYTGFYDYQERTEQRRQRRQRYEDEQRRALDEALSPWTPDPWVAEQRRRDEMRGAAIFGCQSPGNPAAEAACLDAIR